MRMEYAGRSAVFYASETARFKPSPATAVAEAAGERTILKEMGLPDWFQAELPPLDIHALSLAIARELERALGADLTPYRPYLNGGELFIMQNVIERMIGDYDRMRTLHIEKLLKDLT